jgi:L-threonylcarbamoyladenylate synthase
MNRSASTVPFETSADIFAALPGLARHLKSGGLIAYPTETVYGLGGAATPTAVSDLCDVKPRAPNAAFLLLVSGLSAIRELELHWNTQARKLAQHFWPGPLTIVVGAPLNSLPSQLYGPGGGIAVRWTAHAGIARLIDAYGGAITSTSANPPGALPAMDAHTVATYFGNHVDDGRIMLLDGGVLPPSEPSTLVDCSCDPAKILRHGAVSDADLRAVLSESF